MQTIAPLAGTPDGLQFVDRLQLPEAPPTQVLFTVAGQEVAPVRVNVAVTVCAAFMVTLHVPVPEQPPPDQPANEEPELASAVSVTSCPMLKLAPHVGWQAMPAGVLITVPPPFPISPMESWGPPLLNAAVTLWLVLMVSTQVLVPEQSPAQPVKEEPELGVAVRVTEAFAA